MVKYPKWPFDKFVYADKSLGMDVLADCPCALVLVSHDERFLDALTATRWMFDVDCAEGGGLGDTHVRVRL